MSRLIDADILLTKIQDRLTEAMRWSLRSTEDEEVRARANGAVSAFCESAIVIKKMPTVDAVEVVRCKDCIHNSLNRRSGNAYCDLGIGLFQLNDFCSRGERREDGVDS